MASPGKAPADVVERLTFTLVGLVLVAVPVLVFFFSFGNVGLLGTSLGVDRWIAFLTGPAVDLAATGCVAASSYLSTQGWTERRLWPLHLAAVVLGLTMLALNTSGALYGRRWGLAAFDAVGPMLLLGWGALAPWLWRNLTEAKHQRALDAQGAGRAQGARAKAGRAVALAAPQGAPDIAPPVADEGALVPQDAGPAAPPQRAPQEAAATGDLDRARAAASQRTDAILDLMLKHGREAVTGAAVAAHFGIHESNGKRALKKVRELPDLDRRLAERAEQATRGDDPQRGEAIA